MSKTFTCEFCDRITADVAINSLRAVQKGIRDVEFSGNLPVDKHTEYTIGTLPVTNQTIGIPCSYSSAEHEYMATKSSDPVIHPAAGCSVKICCEDNVATEVNMHLIGLGAEKIKCKN